MDRARASYRELSGIEAIWRQDVYAQAGERTSFGFRDSLSNPAVEGSGIPGTNPQEAPIKAGEFLLGYRNEMGELTPLPQPEVLGRNGTYLVFRKLHTRVAAYRQYLRAKARNRAEEEVLAAKIVGRWASGAPLALAPDNDDPALGDDPVRSNDFLYQAGIIFVAAGARLDRQFEFVKTQWINDGVFFGSPDDKDPLVGPNDGSGQFTIPQRPIRRRLTDLPGFVVNRGGEYCFIPSLSALRWLSELDT